MFIETLFGKKIGGNITIYKVDAADSNRVNPMIIQKSPNLWVAAGVSSSSVTNELVYTEEDVIRHGRLHIGYQNVIIIIICQAQIQIRVGALSFVGGDGILSLSLLMLSC